MLRIVRVLLSDSYLSVLVQRDWLLAGLEFFDEGPVCVWPGCRYCIDHSVSKYEVAVASCIRS